MKILVINAGSSSLKYQLIDMENETVMCKGLCERIGIEGGTEACKAPVQVLPDLPGDDDDSQVSGHPGKCTWSS